jgi:Hypothetical protein (DUF2513)
MKRDFDLVRKILILFEAREPSAPMIETVEIEGYTEPIIKYHFRLLYEAGFLLGQPVHAHIVTPSTVGHRNVHDTPVLIDVIAAELTWEGQEFLCKIKNEGIWNKIKETVKDKGGSVAFAVINQIATSLALAAVGQTKAALVP